MYYSNWANRVEEIEIKKEDYSDSFLKNGLIEMILMRNLCIYRTHSKVEMSETETTVKL